MGRFGEENQCLNRRLKEKNTEREILTGVTTHKFNHRGKKKGILALRALKGSVWARFLFSCCHVGSFGEALAPEGP